MINDLAMTVGSQQMNKEYLGQHGYPSSTIVNHQLAINRYKPISLTNDMLNSASSLPITNGGTATSKWWGNRCQIWLSAMCEHS